MGKISRQQQIINMLNKREFVSVNELASIFQTTNMTIRRDLDQLELKRIIRRIHGGAVLLKTEYTLPSFKERMEHCGAEKNVIAKAALDLISPEMVICMDGSTSAFAIAQNLPEDIHLTVVTTGVMTARELCRYPKVDVIQAGGTVHHTSCSTYGVIATDFLKQFNADIVFFSSRAVSPIKGTFESMMDMVEEKRALNAISKKVVLLADHTKFEGRSLCQSIPIEEIDLVITDNKTSPEIIKSLKEGGREVIIA
jgi:DeoR family fructose operon transcriptional repressor